MTLTFRLAGSLLLAASLSLISACSILPKPEVVDVYRLPDAQTPIAASQGAPVTWSLRLDKPMASNALNSQNIAVIPEGNLVSNYKGARWSDPAPALLRNRLLDAFLQDGRIKALSTDDSNLQSDYELGGELLAFQTHYNGKSPEVIVQYNARLVRSSDQRIIGSKRFEVRQPLTNPLVPGVVAGFGQATDTLMPQVVQWVLQQGQTQR
ncbi:ABC-type transport auxiliary lipoprotein family protein [Pseudomonas sp. CCC3.1]|uniref:ABC-type transport auxiliary lipoprotein family protein n=1 Tax=Pseudomonas sp. CCC3.1 TaxID=3048607 RepID=UPI002AC9B775|nr:ABC-type transport auxiliary lipoprotein family protein [Pseudomonas sp. CCC3.1]MEB0205013.1 ABC-type transport auxiliary lipoprotein family protein [Pseudomonas sp. CCC3.1]WPX36280.1 ABC-type transport auxiliary lipoprotein family protein [Pseudomonas sp. CCC3.1]